jgi:hypothetical protein
MKQFQEDFHNALTLESKQIVLDNFINTNPTETETISDYKGILQDIKNEEELATDKQITQDIDDGKYQLMTCKEDIFPFVKGERYYVKIDDMASELQEFWKDNMTTILQDYIKSIKPITWIVFDSGLGTPKMKMIFEQPLNQYFN